MLEATLTNLNGPLEILSTSTMSQGEAKPLALSSLLVSPFHSLYANLSTQIIADSASSETLKVTSTPESSSQVNQTALGDLICRANFLTSAPSEKVSLTDTVAGPTTSILTSVSSLTVSAKVLESLQTPMETSRSKANSATINPSVLAGKRNPSIEPTLIRIPPNHSVQPPIWERRSAKFPSCLSPVDDPKSLPHP